MNFKLVIGKILSQLLFVLLISNFSAVGFSMTKSDPCHSVDSGGSSSFQNLTKSIVSFSCEQDGFEEKIEPFLAFILDLEHTCYNFVSNDFENAHVKSIEFTFSFLSVPIWLSIRRILI